MAVSATKFIIHLDGILAVLERVPTRMSNDEKLPRVHHGRSVTAALRRVHGHQGHDEQQLHSRHLTITVKENSNIETIIAIIFEIN